MRKIGLIFFIFFGGLLLSLTVGYQSLKSYQEQPQEQTPTIEGVDLLRAEDYLSLNQPANALQIIQKYHQDIETSKLRDQWLSLFIQTSEQLNHTTQLVHLFQYAPYAFREHENASLKVANEFLSNDQIEDYETLRDLWIGREGQISNWNLLDADRYIAEDKKPQAIEMLVSGQFKNNAEFGRLLRLGILYQEQPEKAWGYLDKATRLNPEHSALRIYRARILKELGKNHEAVNEYYSAAAFSEEPSKILDELADFYISQRQYEKAQMVWEDLLAENGSEEFWLKLFFWNKVASPADIDWNKLSLPKGENSPFLDYLIHLDEEEFWNEQRFEKLPNSREILITQQESYWLRLLSAVKQQEYAKAWQLLQYNPFAEQSWDPDLEQALREILAYRRKGGPKQKKEGMISSAVETLGNPLFFRQLHQLDPDQMPTDLQSLLRSQDVFSAAFLAAGWDEAAIDLRTMDIYPEDFPEWVGIEMTSAIQKNRDAEDAIAFAKKQKSSPQMDLIIGELLLEEGQMQEALSLLTPLTGMGSEIGFQASKLAGLIHLEQGDVAAAKEFVKKNPRLAKDVSGKEILARVALHEGNTQKAVSIYQSIESRSTQAKSYLARQAYADKNWKRARALTEQLLKEQPDNPILIKNLQKIKEKESAI